MSQSKIHIKSILDETSLLVNDPTQFNFLFDQLNNSVDIKYQLRLCEWFQFFNSNFSKNPCIYSDTIYALLEASKKNELFRTQTSIELEISFQFYEKIINAPFFISNFYSKAMEHLLCISLIYAKYAGLQIRSLIKGLELFRNNGLTKEALEKYFEFLFVQFNPPYILTYNLVHLDAKEIDVLMFILRGNNIRNYPDLPIKLSKKEAAVFMLRMGKNWDLKNAVLLRGIAISKVIIDTDTEENVPSFFNGSRTFMNRLDVFISDLSFWKNAYNLLQKNPDKTFDNSAAFIDFLEYKKYQENEKFSLKGVTFKSLQRRMIEWHEASHFARKEENMKLSWLGEERNKFETIHNGNKYVFKELTNGRELFEESQTMKHCVFSYADMCFLGHCTIWTLKKEVEMVLEPQLTIELRKRAIWQVSGIRNCKPTQSERSLIKKWADEFGIESDNFVSRI